MQKSIKKYWPIFVLPTLVAFFIGFIAPFFTGVWLSFTKFTGTILDAKWVGLDNYAKIWGDATFLHSLWFTAAFTVATVIFVVEWDTAA